ncbi:c-type cytochrome [Dyella jejuensis]|uniref:C-type cytochrome n=1 Tax=Dyella jejuensis TaxID=1432009 RepID=A0ABW8JGU0_9GAMM
MKRIALIVAMLACTIVPSFAAQDRLGSHDFVSVSHGRYLVKAGDCEACHTVQGGAAFAGGRPVPTPFGIIYSDNLTPDRDTGIGTWTGDDFYQAMHNGIDRQGKHLYPAFPYPWFTRLSRSDVHDIKAYLDTLTPVRQVDREPMLPWPISNRHAMAAWNALYFRAGTYAYRDDRSPQWNRGAYLVQGAGHCGACHSDKNILGAANHKHPLQGGFAENVYAPNLGQGEEDGLSRWSEQDIVDYLKTGRSRQATAAGPMAEAVEQSTQYLTQADLQAIALYLKGVEGPRPDRIAVPDAHVMRDGAGIYEDECTGCHMEDGNGESSVFPALRGNNSVTTSEPDTVIATVLQGAKLPATKSSPTALAMPAFAEKLDDAQIAALVTYIRNAWGNRASAISTSDVSSLRERLKKSPE